MNKKYLIILIFVLVLVFSTFSLVGCSFFGSKTSSEEKSVKYEEELDSSTGKWYLLNTNNQPTDTYFEFNGAKKEMSFKYVEDGSLKYQGKYAVVYRENTGDNASTLTWLLSRNGVDKEDAIYAYADDFETNFTQFTTIKEERDEGMDDGRLYAHIYRISELPYKLGTYVLEGNSYKQEKDNYAYANRYQVPAGTYALDDNTSITFVMPKPYSYALFSYKNGDVTVEGVYWTAEDKKTIYLFTEHDPYQYIRKAERDSCDMTYSHDYPPDFYLRGNFAVINNDISITSLYHHEYSPTTIQDSVWKFGTYSL